jgi:hypothetical protein
MTNVDYSKYMSPEQIERAKKVREEALKDLKGARLYMALDVGEILLTGRTVAMNVSGSNTPRGWHYAQEFLKWKAHFGFDKMDDGKPFPSTYLDDCIVCAANRTVSDTIIAELDPNIRANMGVSGLAKRVRERVNAIKVAKAAEIAKAREEALKAQQAGSPAAPTPSKSPPLILRQAQEQGGEEGSGDEADEPETVRLTFEIAVDEKEDWSRIVPSNRLFVLEEQYNKIAVDYNNLLKDYNELYERFRIVDDSFTELEAENNGLLKRYDELVRRQEEFDANERAGRLHADQEREPDDDGDGEDGDPSGTKEIDVP